ncbi:MAG: VCBS repeat-containing protein [Bdellovibrionales bacterium]|nr:VCBS repeat-containing protein [Bdellovibrionales bacterium]
MAHSFLPARKLAWQASFVVVLLGLSITATAQTPSGQVVVCPNGKSRPNTTTQTTFLLPYIEQDNVFGKRKRFLHVPKRKSIKPISCALGDFNNDDVLDIVTAGGKGAAPRVKVFDGSTGELISGPQGNFLAFNNSFRGGVRVAVGDINGDGFLDIVTATDSQASQVNIFDGTTGEQLSFFNAFDSGFIGGVRVATGDINGDGFDDIVTGAGDGSSEVRVFSGEDNSMLYSFFPYGSSYTGGVFVSTGNTSSDPNDEIIVGPGKDSAGLEVITFIAARQQRLASFSAFGPVFKGGTTVSAADFDGDGFSEIIVGTARARRSQVKVFDGVSNRSIASFFAYPGYRGGVFISAGN